MKVSVVISASGSFRCNYATDLCTYSNYASDNICWILAGFQVLLSNTGMLVDLSVTIMQVTVSVSILPKLRYFVGRNYIQIGYKSYSVLLVS